jgi:hypothetical protein
LSRNDGSAFEPNFLTASCAGVTIPLGNLHNLILALAVLGTAQQ